jgi:hypothetical protein
MGMIAGGVVLLIFGLVIMAGSIVAMTTAQSNISDYESVIGELGRTIDAEIEAAYNNAKRMQTGSNIGAAVGLAMLVIGPIVIALGANRPKKQEVGKTAQEPERTKLGRLIEKSEYIDDEYKNAVDKLFPHWTKKSSV